MQSRVMLSIPGEGRTSADIASCSSRRSSTLGTSSQPPPPPRATADWKDRMAVSVRSSSLGALVQCRIRITPRYGNRQRDCHELDAERSCMEAVGLCKEKVHCVICGGDLLCL